MNKKVSILILTVAIIVCAILLAVFIPHFQYATESSGGVLKLEFEDEIRYIPVGGKLKVEKGSKCHIDIVVPLSEDTYFLTLKNGTISDDGEVNFSESKTFVFDLSLKSGNHIAMFYVEVV